MIRRFLPLIVWMAVIFFFSSQQTSGFVSDQPTVRFYLLKSFHVIEYTILSLLSYNAFRKFKFSLTVSYLYAVSDEIHQFFVPGRSSRFTDTLIDLAGILIGYVLIKIMLNWICESSLVSFLRSPRKK